MAGRMGAPLLSLGLLATILKIVKYVVKKATSVTSSGRTSPRPSKVTATRIGVLSKATISPSESNSSLAAARRKIRRMLRETNFRFDPTGLFETS